MLGQEASIRVLREFVASGRGRQQSYLFSGPHGSGKTTLGRILARALLCADPVEGNPCDKCVSCLSMLKDGTSDAFVEVDAATNSGKADVTRITEEIQYSTFSGRQRLYLFDEAHQMSKEALDALLKPLEENAPNSEDKSLVCIFCTTEPEKMRATVLSRCAPAFRIQTMTPEIIAQRLAFVCESEGIPVDPEVLPLIAEITECHVRDALKAIDGVSMLGGVTHANVSSYLHLDLNAAYIDLLLTIGQDGAAAMDLANAILKEASPLTCYERLASLSMSAYQLHLGVSRTATFLDKERLVQLATKGEALLGYVSRFASRPRHPTSSMLHCDIAHLHHFGGVVGDVSSQVVIMQGAAPVTAAAPRSVSSTSATPPPASSGTVESRPVQAEEYAVLERAVYNPSVAQKAKERGSDSMGLSMFCQLLGMRLRELDGTSRSGQTRLAGMGSP